LFNFPPIPWSLPIAASLISGIGWYSFGNGILFPFLFFGFFLIILFFEVPKERSRISSKKTKNSTKTAHGTKQDKKNKNLKKYFLLVALMFCAFAIGAMRYNECRRAFFRFYFKTVNKNYKVTGKVIDREKSYKEPGKELITIQIIALTNKKLNLKKELNSAKGFSQSPFRTKENRTLKIKTKSNINFEIGDIIELENIFFRRISNKDFMLYMIKEHIAGYLYMKNLKFKLLKHPRFSIMRSIKNVRNRLLETIHKKLSLKTFTLVASIFFGKKLLDEQIIDGIRSNFQAWGIVHHLARSGLHLIIFIALLTFILGFLPIPFLIKELLLLLMVLFYSAISWTSLSFLRAIALFILYKFSSIQTLQTNGIHLISLVAIIILIRNPYQLFFLDFQLSFMFTISIAWIARIKNY